MSGLAQVVALPARGTVLSDARGGDRCLRVSWHSHAGLVVLSLWRQEHCVGTFRLPASDVPALVSTLVQGLADTSAGSVDAVGSMAPVAGPHGAGPRPS